MAPHSPVERIVVIGNGMASVRLVEGLVAAGRGASVTVLGEEAEPGYNRILLSAVLEGTHPENALALRPREWYAAHGVELRLDARVMRINRDLRVVELADSSLVPWDRLVLATGSIPTLPPIRGLVRMDGTLHHRVHAFRSLDDCQRLIAALPGARRAVVVGGGLLGLQVARALTVRGLATEVVEGQSHLLAAQLGTPGGAVLARDLSRLGTAVYTSTRASRLVDDGLRLDNGHVLETDLVVLCAGGRPSTALARAAGLAVRRGIMIGEQLESVSDPRIHAIGDCSQRDEVTHGFVGPAWDQATHLAQTLTEAGAPAYRGSRNVARLRATDLDVAVLGDPERAEGEVVEMTNPIAGSHRKLVVRDGVIVAGALVGDLSRVGLITQLYDRGTVLGDFEPGDLLTVEARDSDAPLPDRVEVCSCAGVTVGQLRACSSVEEARVTTRATTGCGGCADVVRRLVGQRSPAPASR